MAYAKKKKKATHILALNSPFSNSILLKTSIFHLAKKFSCSIYILEKEKNVSS